MRVHLNGALQPHVVSNMVRTEKDTILSFYCNTSYTGSAFPPTYWLVYSSTPWVLKRYFLSYVAPSTVPVNETVSVSSQVIVGSFTTTLDTTLDSFFRTFQAGTPNVVERRDSHYDLLMSSDNYLIVALTNHSVLADVPSVQFVLTFIIDENYVSGDFGDFV